MEHYDLHEEDYMDQIQDSVAHLMQPPGRKRQRPMEKPTRPQADLASNSKVTKVLIQLALRQESQLQAQAQEDQFILFFAARSSRHPSPSGPGDNQLERLGPATQDPYLLEASPVSNSHPRTCDSPGSTEPGQALGQALAESSGTGNDQSGIFSSSMILPKRS